jgi:UDP-glucose 4-epimerase
MTRVCVTGGAGFIGSHIADAFLALGDEVFVIDNLSSGSKENLKPGVELFVCDILSDECSEILKRKKPDVVIHAAAQISVRESMSDPKNDAEVNLIGVLKILQSFGSSHLPYFVFISTGGAMYGEQQNLPAFESDLADPTSFYGLSKRTAETYLDLWSKSFGLKYCVLRLANVYGPRQNPHGEAGVVAIFHDRLLQVEQPTIYGDGEQTRDYIYVGDVANAVENAVSKKISGIYNIGTAVETSVNTLYTMISSILGSNAVPLEGPARAGEQKRSSISPKKAKEVFNWEPKVTIGQGLKETASWFKAKHTH